MIYLYRDDPERGYHDDDSIVYECAPRQCGDLIGCTGHVTDGGEHVEIVHSCSVCGGDIPEDADYPLCSLHEGSYREGGRALAEARRQKADGRVG